MNTKLEKLCSDLTEEIQNAYEAGTTMPQAEKLAAKFLHAQLQVAAELQVADLDCRMRKTGVKAIKAAVYLEGAKSSDKKPSDVLLNAMVDVSDAVQAEQEDYDTAEVERDYLQNRMNVFKEAHIYFRGISKGRYE